MMEIEDLLKELFYIFVSTFIILFSTLIMIIGVIAISVSFGAAVGLFFK